MIVKVCDALCGQGKTMSCIEMMNSCTDKKFIFITPYLTEVERIKISCRKRNFISPEKKPENGYSKLQDLNALLRAKENIVSTHALFSHYTDETKELIEAGGYTLVLDEVLDLFQVAETDPGDVDMLKRKGVVQEDGDGNILWEDDDYTGAAFEEIALMSKSKNLISFGQSFYFWVIPIDVFRCFDDAYVLTYLFEHQLLRYFFDANDIKYELIGTKKENGIYIFCPLREMDRRKELRNKIHIFDSEKYNAIGRGRSSLSANWYKKQRSDPDQKLLSEMKNNLYNYFRKYDSEDKMWSCYNRYRPYLKGKGYTNGFVTFNKKATNDYADRHRLAYCINVFMTPWMKDYLEKTSAKNINQDMYALSVLIQWIFRSAIRKGEEVWIYIPSRRMRYLLAKWLDNLAKGDDLQPITYLRKDAMKDFHLDETAHNISKIIKKEKINEKLH